MIVVTVATGTMPLPLKGGFTVTLMCPSGGSAAYIGVVGMISDDTRAARRRLKVS